MRLSLFAAAALCLSTLAARADTISVYYLSATLNDGTRAGGRILFDETTGLFSGGFATEYTNGSTYTFDRFNGSYVYDGVTVANYYDAANDYFQLAIGGTSNMNYAGGNICSATAPQGCAATGGGSYVSVSNINSQILFATSGTIVPYPTATPEPSSIALLGTGLVGIFGVARRNYMSA